MALDLASCRSGRDGDLDAGERWMRAFGEAEEFLRHGGGLQVRAQEELRAGSLRGSSGATAVGGGKLHGAALGGLHGETRGRQRRCGDGHGCSCKFSGEDREQVREGTRGNGSRGSEGEAEAGRNHDRSWRRGEAAVVSGEVGRRRRSQGRRGRVPAAVLGRTGGSRRGWIWLAGV